MGDDLSANHFPAGWHYLLRQTLAQKDNCHHQGYLRNMRRFFKLLDDCGEQKAIYYLLGDNFFQPFVYFLFLF